MKVFVCIKGPKNANFLYRGGGSRKCHFVIWGGLENAYFLYRGSRKYHSVVKRGLENAILLYRGVKKCIGGKKVV